ncbi:dihydrolipoamide acetyltransferase family protein [Virgibacillus soli]|uniref:Dihydrolipoamide acetyltransferase component of pyruvate dehydrogenase complex n=1 Tax=Paracerasibacillus soli TaxID=480284 RepID=A0ABU5CUW2_9BACI|nr:dihydrolipoamide acetyltransferase family protein [Virgibacillus soli]MDY0409604.1 dihydrolipoamide acetyltransferase family protein [Virgibacillus soli]
MIEVKLHDIGEGMTEGEVVHYLIKEGDYVTTDQPLVEVQTDKMVAELPSPHAGVVKQIVIETGTIVDVGTTLLYIETEKAEQPVSSSDVKTKQKTVSPTSSPSPNTIKPIPIGAYKRILATPYTRKIARDHDIDIEQVTPTDPSGRVTEEDVYRFIHAKDNLTPQKQEQSVHTIETTSQIKTSQEKTKHTQMQPTQSETIPFRGIRKQIAKNMTKSLFTIPHVTHFDEIDMTELFILREQLKKDGVGVSVSAFLIKALVFALKDFPIFNAELDEEKHQILLKRNYHIGLATDTEKGLVVPVLHDADKKSITVIHDEGKQLTAQAKEGTLPYEQMQNSTFTMSNVGPLGSTAATPIIHYPETALIAFHKTKKMPVVNEHDEIVIRQMMTLSMSFDHRVADGATAIAFTNRLAQFIEHPYKLMLEMV